MEGQIGWGKIFQSARPAGGWHCSVSSARPYFSRGEAKVWSGLKGRMAKTKFFSQHGRRADGIAQFHPPGHTSAEARRRTGLDWRAEWLRQNFSVSPAGRRMALLSFIRPAILQPRRGGGLVWTEGQSGWGKTFQSARPAGAWHCSVSSARPYFSRGEAEVWSGLDWRADWLRQNFSISQLGRPDLSHSRPPAV